MENVTIDFLIGLRPWKNDLIQRAVGSLWEENICELLSFLVQLVFLLIISFKSLRMFDAEYDNRF